MVVVLFSPAVTLVDQSFLPPSLLGAQLSRGITNATPPLNLESILQVSGHMNDIQIT